ncbi:MAG: hypothetical protein WAT41_14455 [Flavobacteriales bacterium]
MCNTSARITLEDALEWRMEHGTIDGEGIRMMRYSIGLLRQRERFERVAERNAEIKSAFLANYTIDLNTFPSIRP